MFRRWLSGFWRRNREKMVMLLRGIGILIGIAFVGYLIMGSIPRYTDTEDTSLYKPKKTIISGDDISEKVYEENSNIVDEFIKYCNLKEGEKAYNLLTDDCKEVLFPSLYDFEKKYLYEMFETKRTYNIQSWVVKGNYVTYRLRILDDLLSTGSYSDSVKYQDFITINNNEEQPKISINSFIKKENINITTKTDEFEVNVYDRKIYMDYEEYKISIKNLTNNDVLLDSFETSNGISLTGNNGVSHYVEHINDLYMLRTSLKSGNTRVLDIKFKKNYSNDVKSDYIEFKDIIRNEKEYRRVENTSDYTDRIVLKLNLK